MLTPGRTISPTFALCLGLALNANAQSQPENAAPMHHPATGHTMPSGTEEAPFLAENKAAMDTMMQDMAVAPSGDVDHDFVAMMIPHHQGAIDMAEALLRHGKNPQLRRLAQEIIVTQQQEIAAMRLALSQPLPPSIPSPTQPQ